MGSAGCTHWVNVEVSVEPEPGFVPKYLERGPSRAIANLPYALDLVAFGKIRNLAQFTTGPGREPPIRTAEDLGGGLVVSSIGVERRFGRGEWWDVTFDAPIGATRGVGSCWVRLPALTGVMNEGYTAEAAAQLALGRPQMRARVPNASNAFQTESMSEREATRRYGTASAKLMAWSTQQPVDPGLITG